MEELSVSEGGGQRRRREGRETSPLPPFGQGGGPLDLSFPHVVAGTSESLLITSD